MTGPCKTEGCHRAAGVPGSGRGMCRVHYLAYRAEILGPCSADECTNLVRARGLCPTHLTRLARYGSLTMPIVSLEDRFWSLVGQGESARDGLGSCWLWQGRLGSKGYGRLDPSRGQHLLAHRFAYEHLIGPIPSGLQLDHLCRVRSCVNPYHLDPVTLAENVRREHEARRASA